MQLIYSLYMYIPIAIRPPLSMMGTWFVVFVSICIIAIIKSIKSRGSDRKKLPPGPSFLYSLYILLTTSLLELEPILSNLKSMYGPLICLSVGPRPVIFVTSHSLTHQMLIQKGAVFSDRPKVFLVPNISAAAYGPTWKLLRRNLASEILIPSRVKSYSWARKWVLCNLIGRIQTKECSAIKVVDHFQHAIYSLLVLMCFGEKFDEHCIDEIACVQRRLLFLLSSRRCNVLRMFPKFGKIFLRNRWKELMQRYNDLEQVLVPLIKSRIESDNSEKEFVAYVDTLANLKLTQKEMVDLCGEFLHAGTDTTFVSLEWIMANLVKHPHIQRKLYDEIVSLVGSPPQPPGKGVELESVINEEHLQKMPYLKAVVLEGLRRHPPAHFLLHHRVMKDVEMQGYVIPQGATINFMVREMGLDPKVWDDPMEFKPERFLLNDSSNVGVFDMTGSNGIKMMPFGAGRRICPGSDLGLLHLEYFVANLIWYFGWTAPNYYQVDFSEGVEFTTVMKNPLRAQIYARAEKLTT